MLRTDLKIPDRIELPPTDGEENCSKRWSNERLCTKIRELQASDRWTFVFRVPRGYGRRLVQRLDIPEGNILEWEQTERGVAIASATTSTAMSSYFTDRSHGLKSTTKFYADLSHISTSEVRQNLHDVSKQVTRMPVQSLDHGVAIKTLVERYMPYQIGSAFYQLTKAEKLQESKQICLCDRKTGGDRSTLALRPAICSACRSTAPSP